MNKFVQKCFCFAKIRVAISTFKLSTFDRAAVTLGGLESVLYAAQQIHLALGAVAGYRFDGMLLSRVGIHDPKKFALGGFTKLVRHFYS